MADTAVHLVVRHLRRLRARSVAHFPSDPQLLRSYSAQGDQSAFAELLRRHGPMVLGVCRRVLGHSPDAEDAFQATFLVLARKAAALRRPELLPSWLHGVAARTARTARARRPKPSVSVPLSLMDGAEGPVEEASWGEVRQVLDEELGRLPARCRTVLVLCYLDGLTRDEAAQRLGWSLARVKRCLESGRHILRQRLVRRGIGPLGLAAMVLAVHGLRAGVLPALTDATLKAALGAGPPAVAALALAGEVYGTGWLAKLIAVVVGAVTVLGVTLAAGAGYLMTSPEDVPPNTPPSTERKPEVARQDLYGDPLPPGALARFGTIQNRPASSDLAITPDGKTVVTCAFHGRVLRFYDAGTGRLRRTMQLPGKGRCQSVLSPDGRFVAMQEDLGMLVCETASGKQVHAFTGDLNGFIHTPRFSCDGRLLAVVNDFKTCRLLDLETDQVRDLATLNDFASQLIFAPDGKRLVLMLDQTALCLETEKGEKLWQTEVENARGLAFSSDGRRLALSRQEQGKLLMLDGATGKLLENDHRPVLEGNCIDCVAAGDTLALLLPKRTLLWDWKAAQEKSSLEGMGWDDRSCHRLALTPDGRTVFTLGHLLHRWDVDSGKPAYADTRPLGHIYPLGAVAFSPNGKWVASSSREGSATVRLWDVATSQLRYTLPGQGVFSFGELHFTPNSKHLIAAGSDDSVYVFDVTTGFATHCSGFTTEVVPKGGKSRKCPTWGQISRVFPTNVNCVSKPASTLGECELSTCRLYVLRPDGKLRSLPSGWET
jgi:RNA polymerase sigma factor (sigma-70 family)